MSILSFSFPMEAVVSWLETEGLHWVEERVFGRRRAPCRTDLWHLWVLLALLPAVTVCGTRPTIPSHCRLATGLDGVRIENKGRISTLTFFNVSEKDYGNYTCVATNNLGNTNASITLYGECRKPGCSGLGHAGQFQGLKRGTAQSAWPVSIHAAQPRTLRYEMFLPVILLARETVLFASWLLSPGLLKGKVCTLQKE